MSNNDIVLREPAPKLKNLWQKVAAPKKRAARAWRRRGRRAAPYLVFAFFAVTFAVILVNALVWQKTRHSGPLLFSRVPAPATVKGPKSTAGAESAAKHGQPVQAEAQKSAAGQGLRELPQARSNASAPAPHNQISEILQAASPPQAAAPPQKPGAGASKPPAPSKAVLDAQRALVRLGFVLKPDGVAGSATRQAIARYERDRGLPVSGELTPALMRRLAAEAGLAR